MQIIAYFLFLTCVVPAYSSAGVELPLTDAQEMQIGHVLASQFIAEEGSKPTLQITRIEAYLQWIADRLTWHLQRKLSYHIHYDPDPTFKSAFALSGGEIFAGAGVLAMMDTEDQLAAVLGHEMEQVDLNQCRTRLLEELSQHKLAAESADSLKVDAFLPG